MAAEEEASKLKSLAIRSYERSDLASSLNYAKQAKKLLPSLEGVVAMVTALKILKVANELIEELGSVNWYRVLKIEPFSKLGVVRKRYKKLALILHPDKSSGFDGCGKAFRVLGEGMGYLEDGEKRREFDSRVRVWIEKEVGRKGDDDDDLVVESFWTTCSGCGMRHEFERRYVGQNLVCPGCRKSFVAVEIDGSDSETATNDDDGGGDDIVNGDDDAEDDNGDDVEEEEDVAGVDENGREAVDKVVIYSRRKGLDKCENEGVGEHRVALESRGGGEKRSERLKLKRMRMIGEDVTLAELQVQAKMRKKELEKKKNEKVVEENFKGDGKRKGMRKEKDMRIVDLASLRTGEPVKKSVNLRSGTQRMSKNVVTIQEEQDGEVEELTPPLLEKNAAANGKCVLKKSRKFRDLDIGGVQGGDFEIMTVEDSDFYDFDKDRVEKSFKQGQVWAIYDDAEGMPRHYGLIDEVVSVNPFEMKMSWLNPQVNKDEMLIISDESESHVSCGRFKVDKKTIITSVNFFSHVVNCDRAARELYRIYPKKGSVWALYNEDQLVGYEMDSLPRNERSYKIAVFLTSYSEIHGLSMAYLEKLNDFKTVFKRQEIGPHAIRWLEKFNVRLFSHEIPARKLSESEAPGSGKHCWELDPASLPQNLLSG